MPEVEQYMDPEIECDNRSVTRRCGKQADNEELFCLGMLTASMVLCSLCSVDAPHCTLECPNWMSTLQLATARCTSKLVDRHVWTPEQRPRALGDDLGAVEPN